MLQTVEVTQETAEFIEDTGSGQIEVRTSRFGTLTVDADRVISFERGLLGFPSLRYYALITTGQDNYFLWLQSLEDPTLAFVVTEPAIFVKGYEVPLKDEIRQELSIVDETAAQVFVICNKVNGWLTGNLLGPIVVNTATRAAQQVVLTEKKWTTRQALMQLREPAPEAIAA